MTSKKFSKDFPEFFVIDLIISRCIKNKSKDSMLITARIGETCNLAIDQVIDLLLELKHKNRIE
jgi:hypothetical protein